MLNKRALLTLVIAAIILIPNLQVTKVEALPGGVWASGIKIQNLDPATTATLTVRLYDAAGTLKYTLTKQANDAPLTAPPNGSVELYMPNYTSVAAGRYAAVVSSNTQIGAIATQTDYPYGLADSYNGMEGAATLYVPFVYRNYGGWSTEIFVQNTTAAVAHVFVRVIGSPNGVGVAVNRSFALNLNPNGSGSFDFGSAAYATLGTTFFGGAVIWSTENAPLAVAVNQSRIMGAGDANGNMFWQSRGLATTDAGTHIVAPSLYNKWTGVNGTIGSIIRIQNTGSGVATVNVTLSADPDRPAWTGTKTGLAIAANATYTFDLSKAGILNGGAAVPAMFKGSAVIDATAGQVAVMVQHANYTAQGGKGVANGYYGFNAGYTRLFAPSLYSTWTRQCGSWISGIKIQNVGTVTVLATVKFKTDPDSPNPTWTGQKSNISLAPGKAVELYTNNPILDGGGKLPTMWKGSAAVTINTAAGRVVGTVMHTNYGCHFANMYGMVGQ